MTEVVRYTCKACGKSFGPLGLHGYAPASGAGELPVCCPVCKDLLVGRYDQARLSAPACPRCHAALVPFEGLCPACGEARMVFADLRFPGFEQPVPPRRT